MSRTVHAPKSADADHCAAAVVVDQPSALAGLATVYMALGRPLDDGQRSSAQGLLQRCIREIDASRAAGVRIPCQQVIETVADPLHNVAAQLRCARSVVMDLEDGPHDAADSESLHAVQRVLWQCIEACEAVARDAADRWES